MSLSNRHTEPTEPKHTEPHHTRLDYPGFDHTEANRTELSTVLATFWEEISPKVDAYAIPAIQSRIEEWVGKDPELTEALCQYALKYAPQMVEGSAESTLDEAVRKEILRDWESSLAAPRLSYIRDALLRHERWDSLLISYIKVLQRRAVKADGSPEQIALIETGLVEEKGGKVGVTNRLFAEVFDLDWVEQQIPGITKPVTIVSPQTADTAAASASAKLYSKLAIAACGLAVVGAAISSYIRESGGEAMATPEELENAALVERISDGTSNGAGGVEALSAGDASGSSSAETSVRASDRELFDKGEEHAKNSRWVLMMRSFCALSPDSAYFAPAQKDLVRWQKLYPEDLSIAIEIVSAEAGGQCAVADGLSGS